MLGRWASAKKNEKAVWAKFKFPASCPSKYPATSKFVTPDCERMNMFGPNSNFCRKFSGALRRLRLPLAVLLLHRRPRCPLLHPLLRVLHQSLHRAKAKKTQGRFFNPWTRKSNTIYLLAVSKLALPTFSSTLWSFLLLWWQMVVNWGYAVEPYYCVPHLT